MAAIKEILDLVMAEEWNGNLDTAFTGVHYDSRKISKGDIFVAVPGFKTDGHKFIPGCGEGRLWVVLERMSLP